MCFSWKLRILFLKTHTFLFLEDVKGLHSKNVERNSLYFSLQLINLWLLFDFHECHPSWEFNVRYTQRYLYTLLLYKYPISWLVAPTLGHPYCMSIRVVWMFETQEATGLLEGGIIYTSLTPTYKIIISVHTTYPGIIRRLAVYLLLL